VSVIANIARRTPPSVLLGLALLTLLWAVLERLGGGLAPRYSFEQIVSLRYSVHVAVLLLACLPFGLRRLVATRQPVSQIGRGLCMFVMPVSFIMTVARVTAADLWAAFWLSPLMVLALGWFFLGERIHPLGWLSCGLGYAAAVVIIGRSPMTGVAELWPLVGALSFAVYVVLSRQLREEPISTSLFYTGATALVCILPFAFLNWQPLHADDAVQIVGVGVVGLALLMVLDQCLEHLPASLLAPFLLAVPIWETVITTVLSRRLPGLAQVAGSAVLVLVFIAIVLLGIRRERQQ
jgi:drug/metabolite transporter (DMT)-like permease